MALVTKSHHSLHTRPSRWRAQPARAVTEKAWRISDGRRASADAGRAPHHFPQVVAPGGLDVAEAGVEGVFEGDRGAAGEEAAEEALAGLGAALVLQKVEDRAAEDHRVAAAR